PFPRCLAHAFARGSLARHTPNSPPLTPTAETSLGSCDARCLRGARSTAGTAHRAGTSGVTEAERSVLVLSHLYPSTRLPYLGLFVARQVQAVGRTHDIRVVAPTRWLPPLTHAWRNERKLPRKEVVDGTPVYRPRTLHLPLGMMTAEALALPVAVG